jgi:hypothetical protein
MQEAARRDDSVLFKPNNRYFLGYFITRTVFYDAWAMTGNLITERCAKIFT